MSGVCYTYNVLDGISSSFTSAFKKLGGKGKLSQSDIDDALNDIKVALIDADVALAVVDEFLDDVREQAQGIESSKSIKPAEQIIKIISDELTNVLGKDVDRPLNRAKSGPTVIMLIGLQGAGKTTLAGKLGYHLKKGKHTPLLVACDLQRPGAVRQLEIVGEQAGIPVFAPNRGVGVDGQPEAPEKKGLFGGLLGGKDSSNEPVKVARDGISFAKEKLYDTVIIDTAGRLGVDEELMKQAAAIRDAVNPDEVLFVLDATTGQDAINSAQAFDNGVGFTGAVLTKFDSDARGGAALSVAKVTGKPILFSGTGEKFEDLEVFHPERVSSRILDQGDILTLLEQAEEKIDAAALETSAQKLIQGEAFDLNDFLAQMGQIKKMGSIKSLMGMIPGMGQYKNQIDNFDESQLTGIEAIIQSMTPWERANPKQIKGSRKSRIAAGSGVQVSEVNQLLDRFMQMQKMMKQMMPSSGKGGKKGGGGLGGLLGGLDPNALGGVGANGDEEFDINSLADGSALGQLGGMSMGAGGLQMPSNRGNSQRKAGKSGKKGKKGGKSGNPAKRAAEQAALRAKFGEI